MKLGLVTRSGMAVVVASLLVVASPGIGLGQQPKGKQGAAEDKKPRAERIAGVIVKAEKIVKEKTSDSKTKTSAAEDKKDLALYRLSVNTNAVWRDWARDQAQVRDEGSPKKDAEKGANSIATKGQPEDENSLVLIEVLASTKVETRFRSLTDETSKGETTPEKVKTDEGTKSAATPAAKSVQFRAEDLLPGLFVEVDCVKPGTQDKERAASVTVIRPISVVAPTSTSKPSPK